MIRTIKAALAECEGRCGMYADKRKIVVSPVRAQMIVDSLFANPVSGAALKVLLGFDVKQSGYLPVRYGVIEVNTNLGTEMAPWPVSMTVGVIDFGDD